MVQVRALELADPISNGSADGFGMILLEIVSYARPFKALIPEAG
jgi:hypothetical protein